MRVVFEIDDEHMDKGELAFAKKTMDEMKTILSNVQIMGFSMEVERESLHPPAMGYVKTTVRVWKNPRK